MLLEMFDRLDVDDWSWDDDFWDFDSTDVNNLGKMKKISGFDSTDVNNPWDEEELAFDLSTVALKLLNYTCLALMEMKGLVRH